MVDLGINSNSISYEVAVEILGQSRQPIMNAIREEKAKPQPSTVLIKYLEDRLSAIDALQDNLTVSDVSTIEKILDKNTRAAWL
jgi:hypothetical protein